MKRARYVVHLPRDHVARFSDRAYALAYARWFSGGQWADVSAPDGLIAQFRDGQPTPEFAHLGGTPGPWFYEGSTTRSLVDENGLTVARDVGASDAHQILAAMAGDAAAAYDKGYENGFADGEQEAVAALNPETALLVGILDGDAGDPG